jgi:hypothetical protein
LFGFATFGTSRIAGKAALSSSNRWAPGKPSGNRLPAKLEKERDIARRPRDWTAPELQAWAMAAHHGAKLRFPSGSIGRNPIGQKATQTANFIKQLGSWIQS